MDKLILKESEGISNDRRKFNLKNIILHGITYTIFRFQNVLHGNHALRKGNTRLACNAYKYTRLIRALSLSLSLSLSPPTSIFVSRSLSGIFTISFWFFPVHVVHIMHPIAGTENYITIFAVSETPRGGWC